MTWPVEIDGQQYRPIPKSWIDHGDDHDSGSRRLYAVSVAHVCRDQIRVRYLHPRQPHVLSATMSAVEQGDGLVPALLDKPTGSWPRSIVPDPWVDPDGVARDEEIQHLRELWAPRVEEIPGDERVAVTDGGQEKSR